MTVFCFVHYKHSVGKNFHTCKSHKSFIHLQYKKKIIIQGSAGLVTNEVYVRSMTADFLVNISGNCNI